MDPEQIEALIDSIYESSRQIRDAINPIALPYNPPEFPGKVVGNPTEALIYIGDAICKLAEAITEQNTRIKTRDTI